MTNVDKDSLSPLRADVRLLGNELGHVIRSREGEEVFDQVEKIREISRDIREGKGDVEVLRRVMSEMDIERSRTIARCFAQFLNLSNVAEQHHRTRRRLQRERSGERIRGSLADTARSLNERGIAGQAILDALEAITVDVVFTAHPTEVSRRTLLALNRKVGELLFALDSSDNTPRQKKRLLAELRRTIATIWETEEIQRVKPSAIYEAQGGLMIFEQTIWDAIPRLIRRLDEDLENTIGLRLRPETSPIRFGSWAGGDRDGNPNVTAGVTRRTTLRARWMAATLLEKQIERLRSALSMDEASEALRDAADDDEEPYRKLLQMVVDRLQTTIGELERALDRDDLPDVRRLISKAEILGPLRLCRESLLETGLDSVADGLLLDVMRQLETFGVTLARLDVRQEAVRHVKAVADSASIPFGDFSEPERMSWLLENLDSDERLTGEPTDDETRETLDTFRMIGSLPGDSFGAYVISMASNPSDVLAVELLQRRVGSSRLRVVPLFETLDDLERAPAAMRLLFDLAWYREVTGCRQEIMLGYSDSARDGSRIAANWALFQAQEALSALAREKGFALTIFHGRGGTVSRGGGPTETALRSQPHGTINGQLRVTEQGEMIQARFGLEDIAVRTLEVYVSSVLEAEFAPESIVDRAWPELMTRISRWSAASYREMVYDTPEFVDYFRTATPEPELGRLNIGSRPSRRKGGGGVESLRAIPWVFAWTQTRLLLPAWLGGDEALNRAIDDGELETLRSMYENWPFFRSTIDLIEMVLAKSSPAISERYDERLVPENLRALGSRLRGRLESGIDAVLKITGQSELLESNSVLRRSIDVRNPYVDPINLIQIEVLARMRGGQVDDSVFDAFVTTVNGIAAGMRNTG